MSDINVRHYGGAVKKKSENLPFVVILREVDVNHRRQGIAGLAFLTIGTACGVHAAFERLPEGGRAAAMGGVAVAMANDPWALWTNPSLAASALDRSISVTHSPRWLGIPELTRSGFVFIQPVQIGTCGLAGTRFGMTLYRETVLSVVFASTIDDRFRVGGGLTFYHLSIERYGSSWTLGVDAGFTFALTPETTFGISLLNVNGPTIGSSKEKLPQTLSVGMEYRPFAALSLGADLVKDVRFPMEVHLGVAYQVLGCLWLRGGASDRPSTYSSGIGITYAFFAIDYGFTAHAELGFTHSVSLTIYPDAL
jgi:hypothetical protein